jgi:hypothetical protein
MANDGQPSSPPIDPQKQVEAREWVVESQWLGLGVACATDVFFEGCWAGVVGVGWGGQK